ncbi:hypothetical protein PAXINDRAFT_114676, partial [Paxillus involutus ATCC 200175]
MAHGFYCWRIRVMGRSWYVPIFVMMVCPVSTPFAHLQFQTWVLTSYKPPTILNTKYQIWMIANFVCDLIITIETTRLLFQRGAGSSFKNIRGLVTKLIRLTIETGAVTAAAMLLQFLLSQLDRTQGLPSYSEDGGLLIINPGGSTVQLSIFYSISS